MQTADKTTLISFYKECLDNKFLKFDDEYQNYKINAIAKKHKIISEGKSLTEEDFEYVSKLYSDKQEADRNAEIEKQNKKIAETLEGIYKHNAPLIKLNGKEKREYELNEKIKELKETRRNIDKLKDALVESYYSGSKQDKESWFWRGLGTELATGSRALGSLAVAEVDEKNRQINEQNKELKKQIQNRVYNDPKLNTEQIQTKELICERELENLKTAFVSYNKNFFKYIGYKITNWNIENGYAFVTGKFNLKYKPKLPGDISATLDGTCKAIIYRKSDLAFIEDVLIPLPFYGVGKYNDLDFAGAKKIFGYADFNKEDFGIEIIDYNVCAIEENGLISTHNAESDGNHEIADKFLYKDIRREINYDSLDSMNKAISVIENIDSEIEGKDLFLTELKEKQLELSNKKKEEERLAEEKRIAEDKVKAQKEEEKRKQAEINKRRIKKGILAFSIIAIVLLTIASIYATVFIPLNKYNSAVELYNNGQYEQAAEQFIEMGNYKDSEEMVIESRYHLAVSYFNEAKYDEADEIFRELQDYKESQRYIDEIKGIHIKNSKAGDTILFGNYEQDNDLTNGKEEIEWTVLKRDQNKILIISKYILCPLKILDEPYEPYALINSGRTITWETSHARKWLNSDFINSAFSSEERDCIITTFITDNYSPYWNQPEENDTYDKVFLLSIKEVLELMPSENERTSEPTDYAIGLGMYDEKHGDSEYYNSWWTRSRGSNGYCFTYIFKKGEIGKHGHLVTVDVVGARPALWIEVS